jgi:hypothetical protein
MTCFNLPPNFTEDPESLVRRARTHFGSPQCVRTEVNPASFVPFTSTPMARRRLFANILLPLLIRCLLAPRSTPRMETSRLRLAKLRWYRLAHSVASLMKMRVPTCNSSWSCAIPSLYEEWRKMPFVCGYFYSHSWERRSCGSMRTVQILTPGQSAHQCSS